MVDSVTAPAASAPPAAASPAPAAAAPAEGTSLLGGGAPAAGEPTANEAPPTDAPAPAEGDTPKDGEESKEGEAKEPIKPEDYGDFTLPEGMIVNDAVLGEFKALSAELGLSKEQAQKLVDFRAQQEQALFESYRAQGEGWVKSAQNDAEYGGKAFAANIAVADRAVAAFGTPELRSLLNPYHPTENPTGTGLGNHPEIIRAFYRAGLTVTEPGPVNTTSPLSGKADHVDILYPSNSK